MNTHTHIASLLLLVASFGVIEARSAEPQTSEPGIVIDCAEPALPSQREVGEMMGQYNFSQVYATRSRLMAEARRACQRESVTRVRLVMAPRAARESVRTIAQANAPQ